MRSTFYTLFKMVRPINIVIAITTLIMGYILLRDIPSIPILIIQALGFAAAIGFANIENDVLDLPSDKINRPERPLVTGEIKIRDARRAWKALAVLTLLCGLTNTIIECVKFMGIVKDWDHALTFGWMGAIILTFPLWFFAGLCALLITYNRKLKRTPLVKNMTIGFLCATPLLFAVQYYFNFSGRAYPDEHMWAIVPAIPFAFLLTTAREIYKDLEDKTGDRKAGIMTFPLIAGGKKSRRLAGVLIILSWLALPIPVYYMDQIYQFNYPPLFLIITGITLTPCFAIAIISAHRKNYHRAQSIMKLAMVLGIIALIICH